jgi:hypothetical protein
MTDDELIRRARKLTTADDSIPCDSCKGVEDLACALCDGEGSLSFGTAARTLVSQLADALERARRERETARRIGLSMYNLAHQLTTVAGSGRYAAIVDARAKPEALGDTGAVAPSLGDVERAALRHAITLVTAADCGDVADEPLRRKAIEVLMLLSGVRRETP